MRTYNLEEFKWERYHRDNKGPEIREEYTFHNSMPWHLLWLSHTKEGWEVRVWDDETKWTLRGTVHGSLEEAKAVAMLFL